MNKMEYHNDMHADLTDSLPPVDLPDKLHDILPPIDLPDILPPIDLPDILPPFQYGNFDSDYFATKPCNRLSNHHEYNLIDCRLNSTEKRISTLSKRLDKLVHSGTVVLKTIEYGAIAVCMGLILLILSMK